MKFVPRSVWISWGIPKLVKKLVSLDTMVLEVIFFTGKASGYLVVGSKIVSIYICPFFVFGKGPTISMIIFVKGSGGT